jgi:hypothetical protein
MADDCYRVRLPGAYAQWPVDNCGIAASFSCAVTIAIRAHLGIKSKAGSA